MKLPLLASPHLGRMQALARQHLGAAYLPQSSVHRTGGPEVGGARRGAGRTPAHVPSLRLGHAQPGALQTLQITPARGTIPQRSPLCRIRSHQNPRGARPPAGASLRRRDERPVLAPRRRRSDPRGRRGTPRAGARLSTLLDRRAGSGGNRRAAGGRRGRGGSPLRVRVLHGAERPRHVDRHVDRHGDGVDAASVASFGHPLASRRGTSLARVQRQPS